MEEEIREKTDDEENVMREDKQPSQDSDQIEPVMIEDEDVLAEDMTTRDKLTSDPSTS